MTWRSAQRCRVSWNFHFVKDCSILDLLMTVPSFCFRLSRRHSFWRWAAIVVGGFSLVIPTFVVAASDSLSLAGKAQLFEVDLAERFLDDGQVRVRRRLPSVAHPFITYLSLIHI